jgi:hypothetical protein
VADERKKFYIQGYCGQHDEAGACIYRDGKRFLNTPHLEGGNWSAYHKTNDFIVDALNAHQERLDAGFVCLTCGTMLKTETDVCTCKRTKDSVRVPAAVYKELLKKQLL